MPTVAQPMSELEALVTRIARGPVLTSATGFLPNTRPMSRLADFAEHAPAPAGQHVDHEAARERHDALVEAQHNRLVLAQPEMSEAMGVAADELLDLLACVAEREDNILTHARAVGALRQSISVFLEAAERKLQ